MISERSGSEAGQGKTTLLGWVRRWAEGSQRVRRYALTSGQSNGSYNH